MSTHAFWHMFSDRSVANDVPLHAVQKVLGHRSMPTMSIHDDAERQRVTQEIAAFQVRLWKDGYWQRSPRDRNRAQCITLCNDDVF
jgi:integrase